jgi:hypothetical protein
MPGMRRGELEGLRQLVDRYRDAVDRIRDTVGCYQRGYGDETVDEVLEIYSETLAFDPGKEERKEAIARAEKVGLRITKRR